MAQVMTESACPITRPTSCYWKKIWKGLNVMRQNWEFCDVILTSSDNKHFTAHRAMLVASSMTFMNYFSSDEIRNRFDANSKPNLYFPEVPSDVLQVVLDFIYGIPPLTPFDMLKLCAGSKYFDIEEAYEYSIKYFGHSNKSHHIHLPGNSKATSLPSVDVQSPLNEQTTEQSIMNESTIMTQCVALKDPCEFQGILSPDIMDSDSNDGKVDGMAELSLSDLALGNECPHLKKLVSQSSDADLSFNVDLTEGLELKDKNCLNELDKLINSDASMDELPNFLGNKSITHSNLNVQEKHTMLPNDSVSSCPEATSGSICNDNEIHVSKDLEEDLFHFQLESHNTNDGKRSMSLDSACHDVPALSTYSGILNAHIGADVTEISYDSDSYSHVLFDSISTSSSNDHLQNSYPDSSDDIQTHLDCLADLTKTHKIGYGSVQSKGGGMQDFTPIKTPKFVCFDCREAFVTSYKLQTHQLKQHNKGKLFSCLHCPFKSPRKKDLQAHCLSQHGEKPPGVKIYTCASCSYECIDKNRFEEHEAIHQGVLKYNCPLCSKGYTTRRGMKTHLKYHNESRPFKCSLCPSDFKVKSKLTDHMKLIHLQKGVKPYKCGYCDHYTALRGNCNQHIKKNHPGQPVLVIDTLSSTRRHVKNYDYANLRGSDIDEHHEICSTQPVKKTA